MSHEDLRAAILAQHPDAKPAPEPKDARKRDQELARRRNRHKAVGMPKLNQDRFMWRRP